MRHVTFIFTMPKLKKKEQILIKLFLRTKSYLIEKSVHYIAPQKGRGFTIKCPI